MNKTLNIFLLGLAIVGLTYCNGNQSNNTTNNESAGGDTVTISEDNTENAKPQDLMLHSLNDAEMQKNLIKLAEKSSSEKVATITEMIAKNNQEIETKLQNMFKAANISIPPSISVAQQATLDSLQNMSGEQFDQALMDVATKSSESSLETMRELASEADNTIVRGLAEESIDLLQSQVQAIDSLNVAG